MEMTKGKIDGIYFEHSLVKGKPTLCLLSGYSTNARGWGTEFLEELARTWGILLIDNRGTGHSLTPESLSDYQVAHSADDVGKIIHSLNLDSVYILGHSFGGCITLKILELNNIKVAGSLIMSSTLGGSFYTPPLQKTLAEFFNPAGSSPWEKSKSMWLKCVSEEFFYKEESVIRAIFDRQYETKTPAFTMKGQAQAFLTYSCNPELIRADFPLIIMSGNLDEIMPHANSLAMSEALPQAHFHILQDCYHTPYLERRVDVVNIVAQLLEKD